MSDLIHRLARFASDSYFLLRSLARAAIAKLGYDMHRLHSPASILKTANLATIIDGGANNGGFASIARTISPTAIIHSFEPIPSIAEKLRTRFRSDNNFHLYVLALGESDREAVIIVNDSADASSLLPMRSDASKIRAPFRNTGESIAVTVVTLDTWMKNKALPRPLLLKLDLEGYELAALSGAGNLLAQTDFVLVEVVFILLRDGQPSFTDIASFLSSKGFSVMDVYPQFVTRARGQSLYADVLFGR